jgi:hypothetical protein
MRNQKVQGQSLILWLSILNLLLTVILAGASISIDRFILDTSTEIYYWPVFVTIYIFWPTILSNGIVVAITTLLLIFNKLSNKVIASWLLSFLAILLCVFSTLISLKDYQHLLSIAGTKARYNLGVLYRFDGDHSLVLNKCDLYSWKCKSEEIRTIHDLVVPSQIRVKSNEQAISVHIHLEPEIISLEFPP